MSYLGRGLEQVDNISKLDNITFNGGTTYALTKDSAAFTPISSNALLVSIDGVIQQGNFSVSGSNIVFNFSVSGSSTCNFIMHYGTGVAFTPADNSITKDKTNFVSNSSSSGVVSKGDGGSVDGSISLNCSQNSHHTKISSASHSSYSGNLNFVLPSSHGTNGQFMKTDGSGNLSFASAGETSAPVFKAVLNGNQNISNVTGTVMAFATEQLDTGSCYDTSNYRFTPNVEGYYLFIASGLLYYGNAAGEYGDIAIHKNGSKVIANRNSQSGNMQLSESLRAVGMTHMNGSSDYVDAQIYHQYGTTKALDQNEDYTYFMGFRITGSV